ncbi:MAG: aminotransferase class I/II-fold pyridoxal phosphate-dependent enzyme [Nanoarchaeota archaeon]
MQKEDQSQNYKEFFKDKTILITGGLGFIGLNLALAVEALFPKKIIVVDALIENLGGNQQHIPLLAKKGIEIVTQNISSSAFIKPLIQEADVIFNCAGSTKHTPFNEKDLADDSDVNFNAQTKFLEYCRQVMMENPLKTLKIVFAGTRDQYGKVNKIDLPITEDYRAHAPSDYQSISKSASESHHSMLNHNLRQQNRQICINSVRLTNTFGPYQSTNTGAVIPVFIDKAVKDEKIQLWGGGEIYRDINYVDDVVDAFLRVAASNVNGQAFNLGCCLGKAGMKNPLGENFLSIKQLAEKIVTIVGKGAIEIIPYPPERKNVEPGHFCADITKIYTQLDWLPKTSLEQGLEKTILFLQNKKIIPFVDLKKQHESIKEELHEAIERVIYKNSHFILGEEKKLFEQEFAEFCKKKYGIGLNSGTDALLLALRALNITAGDEVIVPANTAIPTIMAIRAVDAHPVLVDVKEDYLIDEKKIEEKITKKTKVIMPVHLYGNACEMDAIMQIAEKYNLKIIEDCCQAHGAEYKEKKVPITDIGCFSFYPSKNLGALGDAGLIVTDNEQLKNKLVLLRNYGQENRYHAKIVGINSRLDELQAACLRVKLKQLLIYNEKRKKHAKLYTELLKDSVITPSENQGHVYHLYVIRTPQRDQLMQYLIEKNIQTQIHYPIPIHLQEAFADLNHKEGDFPQSELFANQIISLPMYPELAEDEIRTVCEEIKNFFEKKNKYV